MTLILSIASQNSIILMGDCLTSTVRGDPELRLFSIGDTHSLLEYGNNPRAYSLAEKIIINDNLTIAYAGDVNLCQEIIATFANCFVGSYISLESIQSILRGTYWNAISERRISLLIMATEPNRGCLEPINCQELYIPGIGEVLAAGSGVPLLREFIISLAPVLEDQSQYPDCNVRVALLLTGALLGEEIQIQSTLLASFGGFYEIAECAESPHRKVTDYCFIFWSVNLCDTGNEFKKRKILRRLNRDTPMEFYAIDFPNGDPGPVQTCIHSVSPLISYLGAQDEPQNLDLNAKYQINVFLCKTPNGRCATAVDIRVENDPVNHMIHFSTIGDQLCSTQRHAILNPLKNKLLSDFREL